MTEELIDLRYHMMTTEEGRKAQLQIANNSFGFGSGTKAEIPEGQLAEIKAETLVLWTDQNPGHGPDTGRKIAELIPGARFHLIEQAAHWPQWEQPAEHNRTVLDFLNGSGAEKEVIA